MYTKLNNTEIQVDTDLKNYTFKNKIPFVK